MYRKLIGFPDPRGPRLGQPTPVAIAASTSSLAIPTLDHDWQSTFTIETELEGLRTPISSELGKQPINYYCGEMAYVFNRSESRNQK